MSVEDDHNKTSKRESEKGNEKDLEDKKNASIRELEALREDYERFKRIEESKDPASDDQSKELFLELERKLKILNSNRSNKGIGLTPLEMRDLNPEERSNASHNTEIIEEPRNEPQVMDLSDIPIPDGLPNPNRRKIYDLINLPEICDIEREPPKKVDTPVTPTPQFYPWNYGYFPQIPFGAQNWASKSSKNSQPQPFMPQGYGMMPPIPYNYPMPSPQGPPNSAPQTSNSSTVFQAAPKMRDLINEATELFPTSVLKRKLVTGTKNGETLKTARKGLDSPPKKVKKDITEEYAKFVESTRDLM